eukprot:gene26854-19885_t
MAILASGDLDLSNSVGVTAQTLSMKGDMNVRGGKVKTTGAMTIEGTVTHAVTAYNSRAIDVDAGGLLHVMGTGKITATGKSSLRSASFYASHGGSAHTQYSSGIHGSAVNPTGLGQRAKSGGNTCRYANGGSCEKPEGGYCGIGTDCNDCGTNYEGCYDLDMAGGRIHIVCGSIRLDTNAQIVAKGAGSASGGTINIQLRNGGNVEGAGLIDVGVTAYTGSHSFRRAGGGRVAILDYGDLSAAILNRVGMDGQKKQLSGTGTMYHRKNGEAGNILVRSTFTTTMDTAIDGPSDLVQFEVEKAKVTYSIPSSKSKLECDKVVLTSNSLVYIKTTLDLTEGLEIPSSTRMEMTGGASADSLSVAAGGGTLVVKGGKVEITAASDVKGTATLKKGMSSNSLSVDGTLTVTGGTTEVTELMTLDGNVDATGIAAGTLTVNGDLDVTSGTVVVDNVASIANGGSVDLANSVPMTVNTLDVVGAMNVRGGKITTTASATVEGTLTHTVTSNAALAIDLDISGQLHVKGTGKITASSKSSKRSSSFYASHGGVAHSRYASNVYGSITNPTALGVRQRAAGNSCRYNNGGSCEKPENGYCSVGEDCADCGSSYEGCFDTDMAGGLIKVSCGSL